MEGLVNVMKDLKGVIERGLINIKKSPKDRLTLEYIETRSELLEKDWALFKDNNTKLHELYKAQDVTKVIELYDSTEDTYITYKCLIKSMINKITVSKGAEKYGSSSGNESKSHLSAFVKLPKISIPIFSGKYSEWTTFRDLFVSLVHNNTSLDNVQKMHYLKSHLTGEAEQLVRQTPVTDSNYIQCWSQLERRYSNKKYLVNCILKRFFGQKRILVESAPSLKDLLDTTNDCLNALRNLKVDVTTWDVIIIHIVTFKLDLETRKHWELSVSSQDCNELPTFEQFAIFIENRFRALECIEPKRSFAPQMNSFHAPKSMVAVDSSTLKCEYCNEDHKLCYCKGFAKQSVDKRREFVASHRICFNCLGGNHTVAYCKKQTICKLCQKRHHSLLHLNTASATNNNIQKQASVDTRPSTSIASVVSCISTGTKNISMPQQVLLATALVKAESKAGDYQIIRALVDQGSQACFVTESTVQFLRLAKIPVKGIVSGLGNRSTNARYMVQLNLQSCIDSNFNLIVHAYVLSRLTTYLPDYAINTDSLGWIDVKQFDLADPQFNKPGKIDILLGADVYGSIMKEGTVKSISPNLIAQSTRLGWILSGAISKSNQIQENIHKNISVLFAKVNEDELLKRFWEIEDQPSSKKILTPEEEACEEFYKTTTKRRDDGRYVVKLPFKEANPRCQSGNSRVIAERRLKSLEKRLERDEDLKRKYTEVIKEYMYLGHLKPVNKDDSKQEVAVYLPHHAVVREDKSTTKLRVVFNASEKNNKGVSLNDTLMVGPKLQADLRHTVLKWRMHYIGLVADIVKMYRQVRIADEDVMFQRILWRDNPECEIRDYELVTITFGTASAPYQAVRSLHQLAADEGKKYPQAADRVLNSFYMDDLMTGCCSVEEGIEIYKQMTELLQKGGFSLQKWSSNNQDLVHKILTLYNKAQMIKQVQCSDNTKDKKEYTEKNIQEKVTDIKIDDTIKILGLTWNRRDDLFQYTVNLPPMTTGIITKRAVLSDIARLFDPLGWSAPVVILAKIFIQRLWLTGLGWDEELTTDLKLEWCTFREELSLLTSVQIPRWLSTKPKDNLELHGFCDASQAAYSAVIYLRVTDDTGKVTVSLLNAKTRVAPIKQVSLPRLELCGAVLLSRLLNETAEVLMIPKDRITAWTDSTIVLAWLNSHPSRWKTFVANRTSEILNSMNRSQWNHVVSKDNPADCASKGLLPSTFIHTVLWFSGPSFLKENVIIYNRPKALETQIEATVKAHVALVSDSHDDILKRFSSLQKLLRVISYCRRVLPNSTKETYLHKREIEEALVCSIKMTQKAEFSIEYLELQQKGYLQIKSSKLKSLCPYLDNRGIIRVQGRLEKSQLDEQQKHPIIIPRTSHFTRLLIEDAHHKTLHGGPQMMINYLRTAYWVIGVRNLVKQCVRKCVTCIRQRANINNPMMGSLPSVRCSPARPFLNSGVDYAGPINIRTSKGRGHRSYKGYICLFVCMSTRAVHLELVSDMSTQAFMAAFRRFVSRRGHCSKLWSDNGTTFVGASRELQQLVNTDTAIAAYLEANGTEWHFIPPHAPNFGGLWEAGVKATKFHLKRVIGESTLTYEELSTLLTQVEACLNSRPMSILNLDDPGEPVPLTPGHFLIGEPLVTIPDYNRESSSVSSLTRWQFVQRMVQTFWRRWSQEYLANLMNRYKWTSKTPEPKIGDVVLIKEDDLPPSRWLLGRILEMHPGNDGVTRVVTLRTKLSKIKRPINKLCILPVADQ